MLPLISCCQPFKLPSGKGEGQPLEADVGGGTSSASQLPGIGGSPQNLGFPNPQLWSGNFNSGVLCESYENVTQTFNPVATD